MKKTIVIHIGSNGYQKKLKNLKKELKKHKIYETGWVDENVYLYKVKHYDFYKEHFEFAEKKKADFLLFCIDELIDLDIFLNELRRKKRKIKILLSFNPTEIYRSEARRKTFDKICEHENIYKIFQDTIINERTIKHPKIIPVSTFLSDLNSKLKVLFFGGIRNVKGIDVLMKSVKYFPKNVELNIVGKIDKDFDRNKLNLNKKDVKKVKFNFGFYPDEKIEELFKSHDLIVMPYEKRYENAHSDVFVKAALYGRPILISDLFPFNKAIKKYNLGRVFKLGDPKDLAKKIKKFAKNRFIKFQKSILDIKIIKKIIDE